MGYKTRQSGPRKIIINLDTMRNKNIMFYHKTIFYLNGVNLNGVWVNKNIKNFILIEFN